MTLWIHWALKMKRLKLEKSLGSHLARQALKCGLGVVTGQNCLAWKHKESNRMMRRMCLTFFKLNPLQDVVYTSEGFAFLPITDARGGMDMHLGNMVTGFKRGWLKVDVSRMVQWVTRIFQWTLGFKVLSHWWEHCCLHIYSYNGRRVAVGICRCNMKMQLEKKKESRLELLARKKGVRVAGDSLRELYTLNRQ